ncbi:MAG: DinB family protein [Saprospiraceae bacterium]
MSYPLFIKMALDSWYSKIRDTNKLLEKISDDQLAQEVAPGRNRGTYLLGHLLAVNDKMLTLLNLGERIYPELDDIYLDNPDRTKAEKNTAAELRQKWHEINAILADHFDKLSPEEWLQKHMAVSTEDFEKEPHRNRLNVLLNRTNHLSYHQGQLAFLKP